MGFNNAAIKGQFYWEGHKNLELSSTQIVAK